jgi:hypothetical protein
MVRATAARDHGDVPGILKTDRPDPHRTRGPESRPGHRARQLVARTTRDMFALSLEALVREAARGPLSLGMAIPLPRREILEAQPTLLGLAAGLRAERPVYARRMALLSSLLIEGAGPAYNAHARSDLHHVLGSAAEALDGRAGRRSLTAPARDDEPAISLRRGSRQARL